MGRRRRRTTNNEGGGGEHQGYRQSSVLDLRSCNADYSFPRSSRLARSAAGARVPRAAQARGHQLSASARRWRGSELAPPGARRNVTVPRKATQTWSDAASAVNMHIENIEGHQ
ncbi:unnamed protein product [Prorocentrum cordatum]|uniref:Uncharacterized protein n=1 Tax=Prorocentrum cordatum TaxID=2364126 RepID=A0ABN9V059_9DINO|nr:unnamed protein product [Polarella glacialis]